MFDSWAFQPSIFVGKIYQGSSIVMMPTFVSGMSITMTIEVDTSLQLLFLWFYQVVGFPDDSHPYIFLSMIRNRSRRSCYPRSLMMDP